MARKTPPLKRFRKRVEYYVKEVGESVSFHTDSEWTNLVLSKIQELSDPVDTDQLARLSALIEVWGTDRETDAE